MASLLPILLVSFLLLHGSSTAPAHDEDVKDGSKPSLYSDGNTAPDGVVVLGDMLMPPDRYQGYSNSTSASTRKGSPEQYLWPKEAGVPTVPYVFQDNRYSEEMKAGLRYWEEHTCLIFRPKKENDIDWLNFIYGQGCWSYIGFWPNHGALDISIGKNCQKLSIVVHEVGHAIGLFHEQNRSDRDDHVVINWQNILDKNRAIFEKEEKNEKNWGVPYDYTSLMEYEGRGFSKNGRITIATKLPEHQGLLGRHGGVPSHRDKHIVNIMYGCIDAWKAKCPSTKSCEGEGYLGRDCTCVCPPGREGDRCEVKKGEYYDESLPACSTTITQEINFSSPNYPQNIPKDTWCVYKVEAPVGMVPEVIFQDFRFRTPGTNNYCHDFLEVRDSNLYDGELYCGSNIMEGQSFVSNSRYMYLYIDCKSSWSKGFQARVVFHDANDPPKPNSKGI